jgi:hypothetical protein
VRARTAHPLVTFVARLVAFATVALPLPLQAVIGGSLDDSGRFPGVGSVTRVDGTGKVVGVFTGVLIAPDLALTAAHVVCGGGNCDPVEADYRFNLALDGGPVAFDIAEVVVHSGFAGFTPGPDGLIHNDLALLRLSTRAPVPGYPIAPMRPGDELTLVGHGASGAFGAPLSGASVATHHYGTNVFDRTLTPDMYAFEAADDGTSGVQLGGGDSGGPAFIRIGGRYFLAGINTFVFTAHKSAAFGNSAFSGGGGVRLAAYVPWLRQVTGRSARDASMHSAGAVSASNRVTDDGLRRPWAPPRILHAHSMD